MNRKLKAIGLALFAAFAFSAIGAQVASADLFTSDVKDTVLTSTGEDSQHTEHVFTYSGNEVKCKIANFSATMKEKTEKQITVTPTYDECTFGGATAEVRTNHCGYIFTTNTTKLHEGETHAQVNVECENEGEHIEVEVPAFGHCLLTIGLGETTKGVTYKDENGEVTIKITAQVDVTRDNEESNFFCSLIASAGKGEYHGASWVKGFEYESGPAKEFTEDTTASTEKRGTTHWSWGDKNQVNIGADTA